MSQLSESIDQLGALAQPFITYYHGDDRVELSGKTTANWAMKVANYLLEEHPDAATLQVRAELHWQTVVWILGAWRAGMSVSHEAADLELISAKQVAQARETLVLSFHPLALPCSPPPVRGIDANREVLGFPDALIVDPLPGNKSVACSEHEVSHAKLDSPDFSGRAFIQSTTVDCQIISSAVLTQEGMVIALGADENTVQRIKLNENI